MKKLLITTVLTAALAGSVFGQGAVTLSGKAYYSTSTGATTGTSVPTGNPAQAGTWGNLNIAIYYSTDATAGLFSSSTAGQIGGDWTQALGLATKISPLAGTFSSTTFTIDPAAEANGSEEVFVVAWTGSYTSWNTAVVGDANGAGLLFWSGENGLGATGWQQAFTVPPSTPPAIASGASTFEGVYLQPLYTVPEPATFALAGLGLASLLIFRRRK